MADVDEEIRAAQEARKGVSLTAVGSEFDKDLYGGSDRSEYAAEIVDGEDEAEEAHGGLGSYGGSRASSLPQRILAEHARESENVSVDPMREHRLAGGSGLVNTRIADRENEYLRAHRARMTLSPDRGGDAGATPARSYAEILAEQQLARERDDLARKLAKQEADKAAVARAAAQQAGAGGGAGGEGDDSSRPRKRRRWDDAGGAAPDSSASASAAAETPVYPRLGMDAPTPVANSSGRWGDDGATPSHAGLGAGAGAGGRAGVANRWDETPMGNSGGLGFAGGAALPTPQRKRSRWDETPATSSGGFGHVLDATAAAAAAAAAAAGITPRISSGGFGSGAAAASSSSSSFLPPGMTPDLYKLSRFEADIDYRNRPLTDAELDGMFPPKGYKILEPPATYVPIRTPSRKLLTTPTPLATPGFAMAATPSRDAYGIPLLPGDRSAEALAGGAGGPGSDLPYLKPEDMQFFGNLLDQKDEASLTKEEATERAVGKLLLKIKNGTPPQRKVALKHIGDKARELGAGPLFNQILPLLLSPTLEDQERHLMVKVIDRILFRLDDMVRPYVHKILSIIEPMLIADDYYARVEAREVISNLAKAAGLATMIAVMRPDIDNADEFVRNVTSRAFAVVASALGIPAILPFLKAVCGSKKSWQARHTGAKIVQQISILMGCAVLPHLKQLADIVAPGLTDEQQKVRIIAALALSSLAEAAHPYGIESFDAVLRPLWQGIKAHRGKALAAFLKAIGYIIPLMDPQYASFYTKEVMPTLIREFSTSDEEMKKIVLKVVKQTCGTEGITNDYIKTEILPEYFRNFWVRRMAEDKRNYRALVDTTVELANKVGAGEIIRRLVADLRDENEQYRRMVVETVDRIIQNLGASDIDPRLEELLMDGMLYAFQEQSSDEAKIMLNGFATVVQALGGRCKLYLPQIAGTIKWRLNFKLPAVRMLAADLVARIAYTIKLCGEDALLAHLSVVLYECLGEEYPEVLGSILGGLKGVVSVIGMAEMKPPVKDLLPRLTPILKNRHEKVQENCIDLVGRIADRGAEHVAAKEWIRICFELLELLKAPRKAIRRAAVNTFGYIAKAIGPQDVLYTLLNNLKVQERQNRVCTTVAIAIVAETCQPFTVLPALMNEYRTPDLNVQNGVLKSLSFMFEYVGEMARDYVYAVAPLLQDALMDRDMVHRQTACAAVKHLALGLQGLGCEDVLQHLLNYVWPNIFETSPHVIGAVLDAVEGLRVSLGPQRMFSYVLQGLFHPARRVREAYWKVYNNLYVYAADALTPVYPRLWDITGAGESASGAGAGAAAAAAAEEEDTSRYRRTYLELLV